eukprot:1418228-Prymnesium_polylepis.1
MTILRYRFSIFDLPASWELQWGEICIASIPASPRRANAYEPCDARPAFFTLTAPDGMTATPVGSVTGDAIRVPCLGTEGPGGSVETMSM